MATGLMLKKLVLKNLLSFGPEGVELELGPLNVLIGPNASGKSNLIDAIRLLAACPRGITEPILTGGGSEAWFYKKRSTPVRTFWVTAVFDHNATSENYDPFLDTPVVHNFSIGQGQDGRAYLLNEEVTISFDEQTKTVYSRRHNEVLFSDPSHDPSHVKREIKLGPLESIFQQASNSSAVFELRVAADFYRNTDIFADWNTSRKSQIRYPQPADLDGSRLSPEGENLPLVLSNLDNRPATSKRLIDELRRFHPRAIAIKTPVIFGQIGAFLEEEGLGENIPFTRLSDGTLRWLCLLAVLLHPEPPSLVCLEEPEIGLHPDMIRRLAELLIEASERTQLIVTTHSDLLVSALSNRPESIVVCEHDGVSTRFHRPNPEHLQEYIANYQLGEAWLKGEIGGTRY